MVKITRKDLIQEIANHILSLRVGHPIRVGIDGITASGKSTFAHELAESLQNSDLPIIETTLDGFHNPRLKRYCRGRDSAEGYYYDAYNYSAVIENLLAPLGPGGNLFYKTQVFNLHEDKEMDIPFVQANPNSILIVDGSFALRRELHAFWDVSIYLKVDFKTAEDRASIRDANHFGSSEVARNVTKTRYHGAHMMHLELANPADIANFVICNNNPVEPKIVARNS